MANLDTTTDPKIIVSSLHNSDELINASFLDALLGIGSAVNTYRENSKLQKFFGPEQFNYEATPYNFLRYIFNQLNPNHEDVFYDLGAGFGRVVLYGAIITPAKIVGIEIVPERVKQAKDAINKLKLNNAYLLEGNVLDYNFSGGDYYFLFNPFTLNTLEIVAERLKLSAKEKPFTLITWGGTSNRYFEKLPWLEIQSCPNCPSELQFFKSKNIIEI